MIKQLEMLPRVRTTWLRRLAQMTFLGGSLSAAVPILAAPTDIQIEFRLPAMPRSTSTGYVNHAGARLYYATYGRGDPVVFLHGGLANSDYWAHQIASVARSHRVIVMDSRGHGRSSRDARPYTYQLMASDVIAVMDHLKLPRSAVVGWSDGAIIGLVMAMHYPMRTSRVFAFAANMDPSGVNLDATSKPPFSQFIRQAARDYRRLSPTPMNYDAFVQAVTRMWEHEPNYKAADLARIAIPVVIADGDRDAEIKAEHTSYLSRSIPHARLLWFKGGTHFTMMHQPRKFNAEIISFLRK